MKAKVIRTQAGKYEVKYDVAECFLGRAVREWRAPANISVNLRDKRLRRERSTPRLSSAKSELDAGSEQAF